MADMLKCPICGQVSLARLADAPIPGMCPDHCPSKLFGMLPVAISDSGHFMLEEDKIVPLVARVCGHCGFVAHFLAYTMDAMEEKVYRTRKKAKKKE